MWQWLALYQIVSRLHHWRRSYILRADIAVRCRWAWRSCWRRCTSSSVGRHTPRNCDLPCTRTGHRRQVSRSLRRGNRTTRSSASDEESGRPRDVRCTRAASSSCEVQCRRPARRRKTEHSDNIGQLGRRTRSSAGRSYEHSRSRCTRTSPWKHTTSVNRRLLGLGVRIPQPPIGRPVRFVQIRGFLDGWRGGVC